MVDKNLFQLGSFSTYSLWQEAIQLIDRTVLLKDSNFHFNTFIINYYDNLTQEYKEKIASEKFYNSRIKTSLFYNYKEDFFILNHLKTKSSYGIRECKFLSYPMLAIHNLIGIYLFRLVDNFLQEYINKNNNIFSYFGGNFKIQENKFFYSNYNLYYYNYYKKFIEKLHKELKSKNISKKIFFKLDIENYYNNISIANLLEQIDLHTKSSIKLEHNFNQTTKDTIFNFFKYIMSDKEGIPPIEQSTLNNFLGYLYLCFAELEIYDNLKAKYKDIFKNIKLFRYVDDIYISLEFIDDNYSSIKRIPLILDILNSIKELLYSNFNLKINNKSKWFDLSNTMQLEELKKEVKDTSLNQGGFSENELSIPDKYIKIIQIIKEIKKSMNNSELFKTISERCDFQLLNEVYDKDFQNYLNKKENKLEIIELLKNINLNLINFNPKAFIALLYQNKNGQKENITGLKNEILSLKELSLHHVEIILEILSQENYQNSKDLLIQISKNVLFEELINIYKRDFNKKDTQKMYSDLNIYNNYTLISQVIMRKTAIQKKNYALALNHLVNEFQLFCFYIDKNNNKNYKDYLLPDIKKFLNTFLSTKENIEISNIFDTRHINQISHSISEENLITSLDKEKYFSYENILERIFIKIKDKLNLT